MSEKVQEYVDSVGGDAHQSAVRIITELETALQKYIYTATMADCFVDLIPEHPLYESIRQDLKSSIEALKGIGEK